jgi:SAM-dependent methyltransferase
MKWMQVLLPRFAAGTAWLRSHEQTQDLSSVDHSAAVAGISTRQHGLNLFLTGFLILFLELASIRWFAANVIFLQFFTNVVLLACFLGMSCGCMAARQRRNWLSLFPVLALVTAVAAIGMIKIYDNWAGLAIDVGHQASPQEVFFGTEYRNPDVAQFTIPIDVIVAVFFIFIALMFVGLGQVLGRAFDAYPNRVMGYTLNIGGSLVGIVLFSLISFLQESPAVWFLIACTGIAYLLGRAGELTLVRGLTLATLVVVISSPAIDRARQSGIQTFWSPYYEVTYDPDDKHISVNNIGHQTIVPFADSGSLYSLVYLLQKNAGGLPFQDVLVIGAGSGNDIDRALHYGVKHIDAVEIDPVIQSIGINDNPDKPYSDPRVVRHIDDGRHFLRTTGRKYDLVVYALVDSLILHSSYANIRLESFLFTEQALNDIKQRLKPGGIFITYNFFRQGWIVERVAAMAESVFGCKPIVMPLPYRNELASSSEAGFTVIMTGCNREIADAFKAHGSFWLNSQPAANTDVDGFLVQPAAMPAAERDDWQRIAPTTLIHDGGSPRFATDDWPFLYLRQMLIPDISIRAMIELGAMGLMMVYLFLPKKREHFRFDGRMFFLGAAFMLLETKAVVQLALLFGSTWIVNSLVFFTALILILLANLTVLTAPPRTLTWHYAALLGLLVAAIVIPLNVFLSGGILMRYVVPCVLALGPMFFAGVIFARYFSDSADPDMAFGSNIAGSVVGGLSEYFSMLLGFRYLLLLAIGFYLLSAWVSAGRRSPLNSSGSA